VIVEPVDPAGVNDTANVVFPDEIIEMVGAVGAPIFTDADSEDATLVPTALVAVTVNV
jgi:hypothetical protein